MSCAHADILLSQWLPCRRILNERLLRDMSGPLTHAGDEQLSCRQALGPTAFQTSPDPAGMVELFQPAPFGYSTHLTPLQQALLPENVGIWELFRNIDSDRQSRVLQVWYKLPWHQHRRSHCKAVQEHGLRQSVLHAPGPLLHHSFCVQCHQEAQLQQRGHDACRMSGAGRFWH